METITFKINTENYIPQSVIDSVPQQGAADSAIEEILQDYHIDVTLEDSIKYLKEFGAWDKSELGDLELNKRRILWLACLDCKEKGTQFFYMGS